MKKIDKIYNSILGTALGDSMGLPYEGLSRQKISRKNLSFDRANLIFGRGLFSDDTEQTLIVAQSLIESYTDVDRFEKLIKRRLRLWLLALPAGVGFATMKSIFKSFFIKKSAVFSAGNAPAMRSALMGLLFGDDDSKLREFVHINTHITHTDPKAYYGALAVAKATYLTSIDREDEFFIDMRELVDDDEFNTLLDSVESSLKLTSLEFASGIGLDKGVGGYIYHTLPIVLHSWLRNRDNPKQAIIDVIECGGDTDTTGAIVGSIIGAKGIAFPQEWIDSIIDYPRNIKFITKISIQLNRVRETGKTEKAHRLSAIAIVIRNIIFLIIVLIVATIR